MISLRVTRKVANGKWDEYVELRRQVSARAEALGMRPGKLYRLYLGKGSYHLAVYEREFEDLADLQDGAGKLAADPESKALHDEMGAIAETVNREIYQVIA